MRIRVHLRGSVDHSWLHEEEIRILSDVSKPLAKIGKVRKTVPPPQQVIGRRGQEPAGFDRVTPRIAADLFGGRWLRQDTEIPRAAETRQKRSLTASIVSVEG